MGGNKTKNFLIKFYLKELFVSRILCLKRKRKYMKKTGAGLCTAAVLMSLFIYFWTCRDRKKVTPSLNAQRMREKRGESEREREKKG